MSTPVDEVVPFVPPAWQPSAGMPALKITNVKRFPQPEHPLNGAFPEVRRPDGTVIRW